MSLRGLPTNICSNKVHPLTSLFIWIEAHISLLFTQSPVFVEKVQGPAVVFPEPSIVHFRNYVIQTIKVFIFQNFYFLKIIFKTQQGIKQFLKT